jgi:hypothetical protein
MNIIIPTFSSPTLSKIYSNRDFWYENIPSGSPGGQERRFFKAGNRLNRPIYTREKFEEFSREFFCHTTGNYVALQQLPFFQFQLQFLLHVAVSSHFCVVMHKLGLVVTIDYVVRQFFCVNKQ